VSHREQSAYGFSGTPFGILKALGAGDARPGDLAGSLQVAPSVVSRALVPLEHARLVERRVDPDDARAARVGLTATGVQRLAEAHEQLVARFADLLDSWDAADIEALAQLLRRLDATIDTDPATPRPQRAPGLHRAGAAAR
jgi:DNA-binding MarR family transcriptional regulator